MQCCEGSLGSKTQTVPSSKPANKQPSPGKYEAKNQLQQLESLAQIVVIFAPLSSLEKSMKAKFVLKVTMRRLTQDP